MVLSALVAIRQLDIQGAELEPKLLLPHDTDATRAPLRQLRRKLIL